MRRRRPHPGRAHVPLPGSPQGGPRVRVRPWRAALQDVVHRRRLLGLLQVQARRVQAHEEVGVRHVSPSPSRRGRGRLAAAAAAVPVAAAVASAWPTPRPRHTNPNRPPHDSVARLALARLEQGREAAARAEAEAAAAVVDEFEREWRQYCECDGAAALSTFECYMRSEGGCGQLPICPSCPGTGQLFLKPSAAGRTGMWWGCSNFKNGCRFTRTYKPHAVEPAKHNKGGGGGGGSGGGGALTEAQKQRAAAKKAAAVARRAEKAASTAAAAWVVDSSQVTVASQKPASRTDSPSPDTDDWAESLVDAFPVRRLDDSFGAVGPPLAPRREPQMAERPPRKRIRDEVEAGDEDTAGANGSSAAVAKKKKKKKPAVEAAPAAPPPLCLECFGCLGVVCGTCAGEKENAPATGPAVRVWSPGHWD